MSTAERFNWMAPEAERLYRQLEEDRQRIIGMYENPTTAVAAMKVQTGEAERECREAIAPINREMLTLVNKFTLPKPIIIDASSLETK